MIHAYLNVQILKQNPSRRNIIMTVTLMFSYAYEWIQISLTLQDYSHILQAE